MTLLPEEVLIVASRSRCVCTGGRSSSGRGLTAQILLVRWCLQ